MLKYLSGMIIQLLNTFGMTNRNVVIGDYTYYGRNCMFRTPETSDIKIGKFCSIANDVSIIAANHRYDTISTFHFHEIIKDVKYHEARELGSIIIGNDVWIGSKSIILKGVNIGNGAIIGAGSVVTKDVPAYSVVGGVPAKIITYRFNQSQIEKLEQIKWWDWDIDYIKKNIDFFYGGVDEFIYLCEQCGATYGNTVMSQTPD